MTKLLLAASFLALALPASADGLLMFSLNQNVILTPPGGIYQPSQCQNLDGSGACVIFSGTIAFDTLDYYSLTGMPIQMNPSNPDGGADVFDNNNQNYFFDNVPGTMGAAPAPSTYTGGIFEIDVAPQTPAGDYFGTATLDYQNSAGASFASAPLNFEVVVTPEPAMFVLTALGCGLMAMRRNRRGRKSQSRSVGLVRY